MLKKTQKNKNKCFEFHGTDKEKDYIWNVTVFMITCLMIMCPFSDKVEDNKTFISLTKPSQPFEVMQALWSESSFIKCFVHFLLNVSVSHMISILMIQQDACRRLSIHCFP